MKNLKRELKSLKGETYPMSFVSNIDIERTKDEKKIAEVKMTDLPRETVQNVLINCVSNYSVKNNKEVFTLNTVAQAIINDKLDDLSPELFSFLTKQVLPASVNREEEVDGKMVEKGLYKAWVIVQIYNELGIEPQ